MSTEEHLYENLMIFVQENGWQSFPEFLTDEEAEVIRKKFHVPSLQATKHLSSLWDWQDMQFIMEQ